MKLVTKKDVIADIPNELNEVNLTPSVNKRAQEIKDILLANPNMSEQEVLNIGLHPSWTSLRCSSCEEEVEQVIDMGLAYAGTDYRFEVCTNCLAKALTLSLNRVNLNEGRK